MSHHRQPGQFGRGRGRGRSPTTTSGSSRQIEATLQSSNPFPRDYNTVDTGTLAQQRHAPNESTVKSQCFYLRKHRVPEHKEGECDKLAVLRQRLAARRRMRELVLEGEAKKENVEASSMPSMEKPRNHRVDTEAVPRHELSARQHTYQQDADDTSRSTRSFQNNNDRQLNLNVSTQSGESILSEKSVVDIELIKCDCCGRSFAPKIYEKHFDSTGQPKCANDKKRPVFNSAKARIANNSNLNHEEQRQVQIGRAHV